MNLFLALKFKRLTGIRNGFNDVGLGLGGLRSVFDVFSCPLPFSPSSSSSSLYSSTSCTRWRTKRPEDVRFLALSVTGFAPPVFLSFDSFSPARLPDANDSRSLLALVLLAALSGRALLNVSLSDKKLA